MPVFLKSDLDDYARKLPGKLADALEEGAKAVAVGAAARVPVDTGDLKRAIHVERRGRTEYAVVAGNRDAWYGHLVEHGSAIGGRGRPAIPPHPFLVPALEATQTFIEAEIARKLREHG